MEIRDRIIEKANELFMQFGIRSVSMDDIANGLGMSAALDLPTTDELFDALNECGAFVNWRRIDLGEPAILVLSYWLYAMSLGRATTSCSST